MKQRVGIARTLLHDPQVLILDEPANGLDPRARIEMRELLLRPGGAGKTLLVTSHILPELARICHRVAIITRPAARLRHPGRDHPAAATRRTIEVLLTRADQIDRAAEVVRAGHVEAGAEVIGSRPRRWCGPRPPAARRTGRPLADLVRRRGVPSSARCRPTWRRRS